MTRLAIARDALALLMLAAGAAQAQAPTERPDGDSGARYVTVRFELDAEGLVKNCEVTASSGVKELDEMSCGLVRDQGRYEPATDEEGKPMAATVIQTLTWRSEADRRQLADMGPGEDAPQ